MTNSRVCPKCKEKRNIKQDELLCGYCRMDLKTISKKTMARIDALNDVQIEDLMDELDIGRLNKYDRMASIVVICTYEEKDIIKALEEIA